MAAKRTRKAQPAITALVPVSIAQFNSVATSDDLALAHAINDATETIIDDATETENDDQPIYIRSGLRNAIRASLALYFITVSMNRLKLRNASPDGKQNGKVIVYRLADVAASEIAYVRKHGYFPAYAPESLNAPDVIAFVRSFAGDGSHFAKCIIAAGIVDSARIDADLLWDSARKTPFYAVPATWRAMIYGDGATPADRFNHQIASDFIARVKPDYHTDRAYGVTVALRRNYRALWSFWRAYLDASRDGNAPELAYDIAYADVAQLLG